MAKSKKMQAVDLQVKCVKLSDFKHFTEKQRLDAFKKLSPLEQVTALMSASLSDHHRAVARELICCDLYHKTFKSRLKQTILSQVARAFSFTGRQPDGVETPQLEEYNKWLKPVAHIWSPKVKKAK